MRSFLFALVVLFLFAGKGFCEPIGYSEIEIKPVAEKNFALVKEAYNTSDYAKMAVNFSESLLKDFTQTKFDQSRAFYFVMVGAIVSSDYLGFRNQDNATVIFFKATTEQGIMIVKFAVSSEEGNIKIVGLWFE